MPDTIEGLADVQSNCADFMSGVESINPALRHVHEKVNSSVTAAKPKLMRVQFRPKKNFHLVVHNVFQDFAHDREERNGPVVARVTFRFLLVQCDDVDNFPETWKNTKLKG